MSGMNRMFRRTWTAMILLALVLAGGAALPATADAICAGYPQGRCYSVRGTVNSPRAVYQVSANQAWVCQSIPAPVSTNFTVQTLWAYTPNNSFVEFGIATGAMNAPGRTSASREWYAARASMSGGWYGENMVNSSKPNRSTSYTTSIRYDGADWKLYHGNNLQLLYLGPDDGLIWTASTGGETNGSTFNLSGRSSALRHQRWGESASRSGWPGTFVNRVDPPLTGSYSSGTWSYHNPGTNMQCN